MIYPTITLVLILLLDRNNNLAMHRADYLLRDLHPAWQALVISGGITKLPCYKAMGGLVTGQGEQKSDIPDYPQNQFHIGT